MHVADIEHTVTNDLEPSADASMLSARGRELLARVPTEMRARYKKAEPFPHAVIDGFFDETFLEGVLGEFPDLEQARGEVIRFKRATSVKLGSMGESLLGPRALQLTRFLNSEAFLMLLQDLTGIEETLVPDPYLEGGGYHEIKKGGFLKIHSDFNRHRKFDLDRRINILVYLNKDWDVSFGGQLELWDRSMTAAVAKVPPLFNRMVVFSTDDFSFHGHPEPLNCPEDRSRKSLALYYYSNGRPASEVSGSHGTMFKARPGQDRSASRLIALRDFIPPIFFKLRGG